ncbi:hypothetical protein D3C76_1080590 [compost metagenome]
MVALLLAQQQAQVRPTTTDLAPAGIAGVGVGHLRVVDGVARQHVRLLRTTGLDVIAGHQWQREVDRCIAGIGRYFQGQRLGVATEFEQTSVRQDPAGLADHQLAHVEKLQIDFQRQESPGVTGQQPGANLQLVVEVTIVVLQMLWTQQHAFLPDDFIVIHRSSTLACLSSMLAIPSWSRIRFASVN